MENPIEYIHPEWISKFIELPKDGIQKLIKESNTKRKINKVIRNQLTPSGGTYTLHGSFVYQAIGKLDIIMVCVALLDIRCPDYLFISQYREKIKYFIGEQNLTQLTFYWKNGQSEPNTSPEDIIKHLTRYGVTIFETLFPDDLAWKIAKYYFPKGYTKITLSNSDHISLIIQLNKLLFKNENNTLQKNKIE
ncbi:hypothetical protein O0544_10130 [Edwardsiella anguillarum]|nr:hypothetical protein [Edwardsiella anguillarum]